MLIILEGADGTGKTSLADQLATAIGDCQIIHRGPPIDHPLVEYTYDLEDYVAGSGQHIVCDRWHWGELVYGPLYRGSSLLGEAGLSYIDAFLAARGALIVHVTHDYSVVRDRLAERGEDYLRPEHLLRVLAAYETIAARPMIAPIVRARVPDGGDLVHKIIATAESLERSAPVTRPALTGYIGVPSPRYLLVGDEPGTANLPKHRTAFAPYPKTSGRWLWDALPREAVGVIGVVNSKDQPLADLYAELGKPEVVAMGRRAELRLLAADVPHRFVNHPQHWRRFRHRYRDQFVREVLA